MLLLLLMNLIAGVSAFLLTYKVFRIDDFIDSLSAVFILYFAIIVITELGLGLCGRLYLENVLVCVLFILLLIWFLSRHRQYSISQAAIKDAGRLFPVNKTMLLATVLILGFGLAKISINLVNPPFGWDDLNYHFTFPVEWLKHGNLSNPITVFDEPGPTYYPINGSLIFLWLMLPLKNVFLADLGQVPFFILAFLSVYSLAKKLKLTRETAFYAAALFLLIPNFFKQLEVAYVDIMVAALFLAALNFLFRLERKFCWQDALLYGISLGLLLGAKTICLPYSALLLVPFIYLVFKNLNKPHLFLLSMSVLIILGGFSYFRNLFETGNPLYPLDFSLFGKNIFRGVMSQATYRAHFKADDYRLARLLFHEGLGAQTIIFVLPSLLLALPLAIIKKKKSLNFSLAYLLALPVLIYLVYRYIIPLANPRYLYPLLGIGLVCGFYLLEIFNVPRWIVKILVIVCLLASLSELASGPELVSAIILTLALFFLLPAIVRYLSGKGIITKPFFIFSLIIFITGLLILLEKDYARNEFSRYTKMVKYSGFWPDATRAWEWLNKNTNSDNIAYAGRPVPFPLYGSNFKNNVYYVSVNATEPAKLHYFPDSYYNWGYDFESLHRNLEEKNNYRSAADYSVWLANLLRRGTDYLFVYSLHQTKKIEFPLEDNWARVNPGRFYPVFTNDTIHIYRVLK